MFETNEKRSDGRVFVVTGANRGLGFEATRRLAKIADDDNDVVYLCSRSVYRGEDAVEALEAEGLKATFHQLDVEDDESVRWLAWDLRHRHGGVDILVNNAGVAYTSPNHFENESVVEQAENTLAVNFFGTHRVCEHLFPLLRKNARVVNVSSQAGHMALARMSNDLRSKFLDPRISEEVLFQLVDEFLQVVRRQDGESNGWPCTYYGVSKLAVTVLSSLQQRRFDASPQNDVLVNAVCPGFCNTRLSQNRGPRRPEEGADAIVAAALLLPERAANPRGSLLVDGAVRVPLNAASLPVMAQTRAASPPKRNSEFFVT